MAGTARPAEGSIGQRSEVTTPEVTVVVPCYNQAHFLRECLDSLVAQTHAGWEAVVVDDASPDSADIEHVVRELGDARVRIAKHAVNRGLAAARNTGIREARTTFAYALDADDHLAPETLATLLAAFERDPSLDCAHADVQLFGRRSDVLVFPGPPPGGKVIFAKDTIPGSGTMMRRSFWERVGGYDEGDVLRHGREDFEFWIRAFAQGCRFKRVESKPLYQYRISHSSMAVDCRLHDHVVAEYIYEKNKQVIDASGRARDFRCIGYENSAEAAHIKGQHGRAFALAARAFRLVPSRGHLLAMFVTLVPIAWLKRFRDGELRRRLPLGGYPLNGMLRYRPFFVIGVARSGNTLLRRILTSHSELHIPPETFVLGPCIERFRELSGRLTWSDLVSFVLAKFAFHPEFYTFEMDLAPLAARLQDVPPRQRNLATILNAFFTYHAEVHGQHCGRWGDKTPLNSIDDALFYGPLPPKLGQGVPENLERLRKVFPDAQFLHLYRDGVDVAASFVRGGFTKDPVDAARRWLHTQRQTANFARRHPEACHAVRYEDLVTDPEATVRGICTFLGIAFEPEMLSGEGRAERLGDVPAFAWHAQVAEPINAANPGKGRTALRPTELVEMQAVLGEELARLGYPPADAAPGSSPGTASGSA